MSASPPTQASRPVHSSQQWVHARLPRLLRRHLAGDWREPPRRVDAPALASLAAALEQHRGPLILDSFCGTGDNTARLAAAHPEALVIGVDKSAARLARHRCDGAAAPRNYLLLQANCEAVWRHLLDRERHPLRHQLLYPNPWPKPGHLQRRIHGHGSFPLLLRLGGDLELCSNWQLYVEEFGVALHLAGFCAEVASVSPREAPRSAFERKYRASGHTLWRLRARLGVGRSDSVRLP